MTAASLFGVALSRGAEWQIYLWIGINGLETGLVFALLANIIAAHVPE